MFTRKMRTDLVFLSLLLCAVVLAISTLYANIPYTQKSSAHFHWPSLPINFNLWVGVYIAFYFVYLGSGSTASFDLFFFMLSGLFTALLYLLNQKWSGREIIRRKNLYRQYHEQRTRSKPPSVSASTGEKVV